MKKGIRGILCLMFVALCALGVNAQTFEVKGVLVDSVSGESEPFATVRVYSEAKMKTPLMVDVTDENGRFKLNIANKGEYVVALSSVGKKPAVRSLKLDAEQKIDFGKVFSGSADNVLQELVVEAARPLVKAEVDKLTYDVESDPDSKTNTITGMLRKVPLVTVDGEDNIQVNGSGNFKVLVDGKPNTLMSNNPKEVLRSMPASVVKRIEVISDPGAKYDAEGVGGVLNIITADARMQGYNMSVNANVDNKTLGGGFFTTVQVGKFTMSANYNYNYTNQGEMLTDVLREDFNNKEMTYLSTRTDGDAKARFQFGNISASYEIDSLNLVTLSGNIFKGSFNTENNSRNETFNFERNPVYSYNSISSVKNRFGGSNLGLDYQRTFRKPGEYLTVSYRLDYSPSGGKTSADYENVTDVPFSLLKQSFDNDARTTEHTVQVDYANPISKMHYIDFGGKYLYRQNKSDAVMWQENESGAMVENHNRSSRYSQLRNIVAVYADYKLTCGKFGAMAGARYEYTFMNVDYALLPERNHTAKMNDVVPSLRLSYMLKPTTTIKFNYAMRINRPGINFLNPFVDDSNPTSISYGNPDLDTEQSHKLSLSLSRMSQKFMINADLGYNFSNNGIEQYSQIREGIMVNTYGNVARRRDASLSVWANWNPWVKTRFTVNLRGSYVDFKSQQLGLHNYGYNLNVFANAQQTLPWDMTLSANVMYNTGQKTLQGNVAAMAFLGFDLSKSFLKDKSLSVSLKANSPFQKNIKINTVNHTDSYRQETLIVTPIRTFGFSVSWRFGNLKASVKKTARSIENDDVAPATQGSAVPGTNIGAGM